MTIGHNAEGCEYSGTVNNYNGLSEVDIDKIIADNLASAQAEINRLEAENLKLREDAEYFKATAERYLKMLENSLGQKVEAIEQK